MYNDTLTSQIRQRQNELTSEAAQHRLRSIARFRRRSHPKPARRT